MKKKLVKNPDGTTSIVGGFDSKKDGNLVGETIFRKPTKEELTAKPEVEEVIKTVKPVVKKKKKLLGII